MSNTTTMNKESYNFMDVPKIYKETLQGADAVVFAVRHQHYLSLTADAIVEGTARPVAVVDCFGILDDDKIRRLFELGFEVKGLGRGHMKRIKDETKANRKTQ